MRSASSAPTAQPVRINSRAALADEPRRADRAEVDERRTETPTEEAEDPGPRRDSQVARQRELHSVRNCRALERGDHRL
jgi:hypothetical protein